jgi:hypothetical protein
MSVQTTYAARMTKAYAGQLADLNDQREISRIAEGGVIPFGRMLSRGTADNQATLGGTDHIGISVRDLAHENGIGTELQQYAVTDVMNVLQSGSIFLELITTGSPGDALYSVDADGTIGAGAPAAGQTAIVGGTLEETVAAINTVALCRIKD